MLLAKLAGAMKGNLTKAAGLFQAPLSQVARLAAALQEKKAADAPAAEAPAAEDAAPAAEAPADDTAAADTTPETEPPPPTRPATTDRRRQTWPRFPARTCSTRSRR